MCVNGWSAAAGPVWVVVVASEGGGVGEGWSVGGVVGGWAGEDGEGVREDGRVGVGCWVVVVGFCAGKRRCWGRGWCC